MKQIIAYQCEYCKFYRKTKSAVKKHEKKCFYNPKNKVCGSCKHNILIDYDINDLQFGENVTHTIKVRWCFAKNKELEKVITKTKCKMWDRKN